MIWLIARVALSSYLLTRRRSGTISQLTASLLLPRPFRFLASTLTVGKIVLDELRERGLDDVVARRRRG